MSLPVLTAICDALVPSLPAQAGDDPATAAFWQRTASDAGVPPALAQALRDYLPSEQYRQLQWLFALLANPAGSFLLTGHWGAFQQLPLATRQQVLANWAISPLPALRQAFLGIKRLTMALFYSLPQPDDHQPNHTALRYPTTHPAPPAQAPTPRLRNLHTIPHKLTCDVVIVGSGAGGGVVADLLAQAGYSVIILEKGGAYQPHNFPTHEYPAFRALYEHAGLLTTADAALSVLAGSTLGGGTTINWMACLRTPPEVLEEWKRDFGLGELAAGRIQRATEAVAEKLQINWQGAPRNPQQEVLWQASHALGQTVAMVGWNSGGCTSTHCSWCGFGCRHDHKNSTAKTYLASAQAHGAQIVTDCFVKQVTVRNGRATGVLAEIQQGGQTLPLTVSAQRVVLAGGAIHSPLVLQRTGLNNPNIGQHLRLHPVTAARGEFSHPIEMWNGAMLTVVNSQFANLDGKGYGVRIENPPAHPGLLGSALPWLSGKQHKAQMLRMANQAALISLARDVGSGRVLLNSAGKPRLDYQVSQTDKRHLLVGLQESLRLLRVAGAGELGTLQSGLPALPAGASDAQFSAWLDQVAQVGLRPNAVGMFSAHQMGTCRMTGNRASGVVKPSGESWEVAGLFVADGSLFPTASGVNPMLTIMAMAHCVGEELRNDLPK